MNLTEAPAASPSPLPRELARALKRPEYDDVPESEAPAWQRMVAWAIIFLLSLTALVGVVGSAAASASEEGDDESSDFSSYSFYELGSEMTNLFSTIQEPGGESWEDDDWDWLLKNPGSAGSFIGYMDESILENPSNWMKSMVSASSDSYGYDSLVLGTRTGMPLQGSSPAEEPFYAYARYGSTLDALGLSNTRMGSGLNMGAIPGLLMWGVYLAASSVNAIMHVTISIIAVLNPFSFFFEGLLGTNPDPSYADALGKPDDAFSDFGSFLRGIYIAAHAMAWQVTIPLLIAFLLFGMLFMKNMNKGSALKKMLIRMAFIVIGLPLLGSMYSATLSGLADQTSGTNGAPARIVLSTYVDFESWANNTRLQVPNGAIIQWSEQSKEPTVAAESAMRENVARINALSHGMTGLVDASHRGSQTDFAAEALRTSTAVGDEVTDAVQSIMSRYTSGQTVSPSAFENAITSQLSVWTQRNSTSVDDAGAYATGLFRQISENSYDKDARDDDGNHAYFGDRSAFVTASQDYSARDLGANPLISVTQQSNNRVGLQATSDSSANVMFTSENVRSCTRSILDEAGQAPQYCNMSPLAMYNFISTIFNENSAVVYSARNVSSVAVRESYASVSLAGTGVTKYMSWLGGFAILIAFTLIGISYAMALLFGSLKRGIKVITMMPFATMGALGAIAKVIAHSLGMLVQVLVTIYIYVFFQYMLMSIPGWIENGLTALLTASEDTGGGVRRPADMSVVLGNTLATIGILPEAAPIIVGAKALLFAVLLITVIIPIGLMILALKSRSALIKGLEEMINKAVEKFTDTGVGAPVGSNIGGAVAGAAGSGLGMAAANKMLSPSTNGPKASSPTAAGPSPVGGTGGGSKPGADGTGGAGGAGLPGAPGGGSKGAKGSDGGPSSGSGGSGLTSAGDLTAGETKAEGERIATRGLTMNPDTPSPTEQPNAGRAAGEQHTSQESTQQDQDRAVRPVDTVDDSHQQRTTAEGAQQPQQQPQASPADEQRHRAAEVKKKIQDQQSQQPKAETKTPPKGVKAAPSEAPKKAATSGTKKAQQPKAGQQQQPKAGQQQQTSSQSGAARTPQAQQRDVRQQARAAVQTGGRVSAGQMTPEARQQAQAEVAAAHAEAQSAAGTRVTPAPRVDPDGTLTATRETPSGKVVPVGAYTGAVADAAAPDTVSGPGKQVEAAPAPAPVAEVAPAAEAPSAARQAMAATVGATTARTTAAALGGDEQAQASAASSATQHAAVVGQSAQRAAENAQRGAQPAQKGSPAPTTQPQQSTPEDQQPQQAQPKPVQAAPVTPKPVAPKAPAKGQAVRQQQSPAAPQQDQQSAAEPQRRVFTPEPPKPAAPAAAPKGQPAQKGSPAPTTQPQQSTPEAQQSTAAPQRRVFTPEQTKPSTPAAAPAAPRGTAPQQAVPGRQRQRTVQTQQTSTSAPVRTAGAPAPVPVPPAPKAAPRVSTPTAPAPGVVRPAPARTRRVTTTSTSSSAVAAPQRTVGAPVGIPAPAPVQQAPQQVAPAPQTTTRRRRGQVQAAPVVTAPGGVQPPARRSKTAPVVTAPGGVQPPARRSKTAPVPAPAPAPQQPITAPRSSSMAPTGITVPTEQIHVHDHTDTAEDGTKTVTRTTRRRRRG